MFPVIRQLFIPLSYLRIKNNAKRVVDFYIPAMLSVILTTSIALLPFHVPVFGDHGLVTLITNLLQILAGFYIAALAAVATFQSPVLDEPLDGEPAILDVKRRGSNQEIPLTRRSFISYLFGYLSLMSIVIYLFGGLSSIFAHDIPVSSSFGMICLRYLFILIFTAMTANLITVTLLGLYYLTDRIHRPSSRPVIKPDSVDDE